jgi:hypothetical protein
MTCRRLDEYDNEPEAEYLSLHPADEDEDEEWEEDEDVDPGQDGAM